MPFDDRQAQCQRHLPGQFGFARSRLALDQQRALQCHGGIHRDGQIIRGNIAGGAGEVHESADPFRRCGWATLARRKATAMPQ